MKKCNCGYKNSDKNFKYCPMCGEKAKKQKPDKISFRYHKNGNISGMRIEEDDGEDEVIHIRVGTENTRGIGIKSLSDLMY